MLWRGKRRLLSDNLGAPANTEDLSAARPALGAHLAGRLVNAPVRVIRGLSARGLITCHMACRSSHVAPCPQHNAESRARHTRNCQILVPTARAGQPGQMAILIETLDRLIVASGYTLREHGARPPIFRCSQGSETDRLLVNTLARRRATERRCEAAW